jgi:monofunctional biosynthetic peptidoglycan transglycosylase
VSWLAGLLAAWLLVAAPPPLWYRVADPRETAFMAMQERWGGEAAAQLPEVREYRPVPLEAIAPAMQRAVLVAEDNRFHEHRGFDWVEIRRAVRYPRDQFEWGNSRHRADLLGALGRTVRSGGPVRGASTITQQLAKNLYLSPSRNPFRKLKEAVLAKRLEWALSKERILELYLNVAEFGPGIWGVEAASQVYFNKPASRLSRGEAAALAAVLPSPRLSNPSYQPAQMRARQAMILQRMR